MQSSLRNQIIYDCFCIRGWDKLSQTIKVTPCELAMANLGPWAFDEEAEGRPCMEDEEGEEKHTSKNITFTQQ